MRIGLVIGIHGTADDHPGWSDVLAQARAAEAAGFDLLVLEDALLYRDETREIGYWEAVSMVAALAAATERIELGHGVLNAPYRPATMTAKLADTLDEISGGRYVFGIGLGNTPYDYEPYGIPADHKYSRFAEALPIIRDLLRGGRVSFAGDYHAADGAELVVRGPRPSGPPIIVAGKGPKMLRLTVELADGWNWWTAAGTDVSELEPIVKALDEVCRAAGRDPATLSRSLDVYSVVPPGAPAPDPIAEGVLRGSTTEVADALLGFGRLGFDEVRVDLAMALPFSERAGAIHRMREVVGRLHAAP